LISTDLHYLGKERAMLILSEDEQILSVIERALGWQAPPDTKFNVRLRDNGYDSSHPIAMNMEGIELDECGYLIGDDYDTRVRHADSVRNRP
jgi:hypothetical protein